MSNQENNFKPANLSWDDNDIPYSEDYQDIFYSKADALAESSYIFLEANNLIERWQRLNNEDFIIAECGFGGGLNFLNTCKLWCEKRKSKTTKPILYYLACEQHPFTINDLTRLQQKYPDLAKYSEKLLQAYPPLYPGIHSRDLYFGDNKVVLMFLFGDARALLEQVWQLNGFRVDAWYLDGFSPSVNADMWDEHLCSALAALSKTGTTLSTYSAAGLIKKALRKNSFVIERKTGFANKRHMLVGKYRADKQAQNIQHAWFQLPNPDCRSKRAIVIGGGLAGCSSASELANAGWQVTLIEREKRIANKASGNPLGIVYCKVSNSAEASAEYYLHSYLFALEQYRLLASRHAIDWQPCGVLQIAHDAREQARQETAIKKLSSAGFLNLLDAREASKVAGIKLGNGGLYFPESGFLNPQALCHAYMQHSNITCITDTKALALHFKNNIWHIESSNRDSIQAPIVIIANSHDALDFQQSQHYPLLTNYGQIDQYSLTKQSNSLSCVLCAKAYILPADNKTQHIGGVTNTDQALAADIDNVARQNLELLNSVNPVLAEGFKKSTATKSRTGIRCSSPDYLPIVGPVENKEQCLDVFNALRRNAKANISQTPIYEPGLFINVAHGSHGLSSTPIAAKYLTNLINNSPLPLANTKLNCLHPIRFLIADLKKQLL